MRKGDASHLPAPPEVRRAVSEFIQMVRERTDAAGRIVVYGSVVRGEYGPDSDVDVLVEWNGDVHEAWSLLALASEEVLGRHKVMITAFPLAEQQRQMLADMDALFLKEVEAEGVVVA